MNTPDEPQEVPGLPVPIPSIEDYVANFTMIARMYTGFYTALKNNGMGAHEALALTRTFLRHMLMMNAQVVQTTEPPPDVSKGGYL